MRLDWLSNTVLTRGYMVWGRDEQGKSSLKCMDTEADGDGAGLHRVWVGGLMGSWVFSTKVFGVMVGMDGCVR